LNESKENTKQQLVPARIIPSPKDNPVFPDLDDVWAHDYFEPAMRVSGKIKRFTEAANVKVAEVRSRLKAEAADLENTLRENEHPATLEFASAAGISGAPIAHALIGLNAPKNDAWKDDGNESILPKFTIMALEDVYPITNTGITYAS